MHTVVYEESLFQITMLCGGVLREIIKLELDILGRGFVFFKARVMSSVCGMTLFVCISLRSSKSWYSYGLVWFCCSLMMMIFV